MSGKSGLYVVALGFAQEPFIFKKLYFFKVFLL